MFSKEQRDVSFLIGNGAQNVKVFPYPNLSLRPGVPAILSLTRESRIWVGGLVHMPVKENMISIFY